jgi:AcrR family transcriptional regulator
VARRASAASSDRILEASEEVFAEHGYGDASLRQLMAAAGVSTTAFYARFASKEAVMAALTTRLFGDLYADAARVLDQARDLDAGIALGVELLVDRFESRKALVRMILSEAGSAPGCSARASSAPGASGSTSAPGPRATTSASARAARSATASRATTWGSGRRDAGTPADRHARRLGARPAVTEHGLGSPATRRQT